MTQLLEMVRKLTDDERRELKKFVENLFARRKSGTSVGKKISYEGWAGCLANVHPELSDAQFNQLILDEWAQSAWQREIS